MTKPYDYQRVGINQIEEFNGIALLADEQGLGKTLQTLIWMKRNYEIRPVLVICPAIVKYNWEQEARIHIGMRAQVLESQKPEPLGLVTPPMLIINYDILKFWIPYLRKLKIKLVIIDESHFCASMKTQRTKAVKMICKGVPHIIALSGTPLTNNPSELWPILNILRPDKYKSATKFVRKYCKMKMKPWGMTYAGPKNLDILHRRLKRDLMIRRLQCDVLKDLPASRRIIVPIKLKQQKEYDQAKDDFLKWIRHYGGIEEARHAARAKTLTQTNHLKRLAALLKVPSIIDWIDNFLQESDQKLVIFGWHKAVLGPLREKYGNNVSFVDGSVVAKQRAYAVKQFMLPKGPRLFLCNMKAGGIGINLVSAWTSLTVELSWNPADHLQALKRLHRIGQLNPVTNYFLIAKDTIERSVCKRLDSKLDTMNQTLDGDAPAISLFEDLTLEDL